MIINGHEFAVNTAFVEMLAESLKVRPCSYDPTPHLEVYTDSTGAVTGFGLPLACKRLWFAAYCQEQGLVGQIIPELLNNEFRVIDIEIEENGQKKLVPRYYTSAKANIYLDGNLVSTGFASHCFPFSEASIAIANQTVTSNAISKALSNAGFGTVDFGKLADSSPTPNPAPDENAQLPFETAFDPAPAVPAPASESAAPASVSAAPAAMSTTQSTPVQQHKMQSLFAQLGGVDDELSRAKATLYPLRGYYAGKPLGELPTNALETLTRKQSAEPNVQAAQNAAILILEDRKKANGKAIR